MNNNTRAFEKLLARLRTLPPPDIVSFSVAPRPTPSFLSAPAAYVTWHPPTRMPSSSPSTIPAGVSAGITALILIIAVIRCGTNI